MWKNFGADESGVTSIEYAIIASLIFDDAGVAS